MRFATQREIDIMRQFLSKNILTVDDLSIESVAHAFGIHVDYHDYPSRCIYEDDFALIKLFRNQSLPYIRKDFFHELAHVLGDWGDQRKMGEEQRDYSEARVNNFILYGSMPRHIFLPLMIEHRSVDTLANLFELPTELVKERIGTLEREKMRRLSQSHLNELEKKQSSRSLQPGEIYPSTYQIVRKLADQVGEEKLSYEVARLLRLHRRTK